MKDREKKAASNPRKLLYWSKVRDGERSKGRESRNAWIPLSPT